MKYRKLNDRDTLKSGDVYVGNCGEITIFAKHINITLSSRSARDSININTDIKQEKAFCENNQYDEKGKELFNSYIYRKVTR